MSLPFVILLYSGTIIKSMYILQMVKIFNFNFYAAVPGLINQTIARKQTVEHQRKPLETFKLNETSKIIFKPTFHLTFKEHSINKTSIKLNISNGEVLKYFRGNTKRIFKCM